MKKLLTAAVLTAITVTLSAAPSIMLRVRNTGDAGNTVTISKPSAGKVSKAIALKEKTAGSEQRLIAPLSEKETTLSAAVAATSKVGKNNLRVYILGGAEGKKANRIFHWATVTSVKINGKESLKKPFINNLIKLHPNTTLSQTYFRNTKRMSSGFNQLRHNTGQNNLCRYPGGNVHRQM